MKQLVMQTKLLKPPATCSRGLDQALLLGAGCEMRDEREVHELIDRMKEEVHSRKT